MPTVNCAVHGKVPADYCKYCGDSKYCDDAPIPYLPTEKTEEVTTGDQSPAAGQA